MKTCTPFRPVNRLAPTLALLSGFLFSASHVAAQTLDFGDAPAPYPTTLAVDGARHTATGPRLGARIDTEANGQPNATATGDDTTGGNDDEDGVLVPAKLVAGGYAQFIVTASTSAKLDAWIDFNHDGDWNDAGEHIATALPVVMGVNPLSVLVPIDLALTPGSSSPSVARFRLSTAGNLAPTGAAPDGEVEDYTVTLSAPAPATNVRALYANGQVFVVWDYTSAFAPQTFEIYRSDTPFTSTTAPGVTRAGRLFDVEYSGSDLGAEMIDAFGNSGPSTFRIPDGSGGTTRLQAGQGLFVATVRANANRYYAVVPAGQTTVTTANRTAAPVTEKFSLAEPPTCHLQGSGANVGHPVSYYVLWVDGDDNPAAGRSDFPVMANTARAGVPHPFLTVAPAAGLPAQGPYPASLAFHSGDARCVMWLPEGDAYKSVGTEPTGGYLIALEDRLHKIVLGTVNDSGTQWFGHVPAFDPFSEVTTLPANNAILINFTQRRLSWTLDWLLANASLNLDPERIAVVGHSGGAKGAMRFTHAYPNRVSSVVLFSPDIEGHLAGSTLFSNAEIGIAGLFGSPAQNLATNITNYAGQPVHSNDLSSFLPTLSTARDFPFTRIFYGLREENWINDRDRDHKPDIGQSWRIADTLGLGAAFYWDLREHGVDRWTYQAMVDKLAGFGIAKPPTWTIDDLWVPSMADQFRRDDVSYQTRYRVHQSYPAFFNAQKYTGYGSFGTSLYPNNQGTYYDEVDVYLGTLTAEDGFPPVSGSDDRGTWGGYHEWEPSTIVDTSTKWEATLWLVNNAVQTTLAAVDTSPLSQLTADVAIRKPQLFKPAPGSTLAWKVTSAASGTLLQSGTATVAADGLVSIVGVTVLRDPNKVKLTIEGPPAIAAPTPSQSVALGATATFTATPEGTGPFTYQWMFNGTIIPGATASTYTRTNVQPANAGAYSVLVTNTLGSTASLPAVLGVTSTAKVAGNATEFAANIVHPNGNIYDQVLLNGPAATITADAGQVTRTSFIDLSDDIVQVEFSGPGTLTITLENVSGPAVAVNYNQPTVQYVKGHATLTIAGATENTHVSAFTVGTTTAVNQSIFKAGVVYDGVADLSVLNIVSPTNRLGGIRMANTEFSATKGFTGLNAPAIRSAGPVNLHNLSAADTATPLLLTGTIDTAQIGITGGDLLQPNGKAIQIGSVPKIAMLAGTTSHGTAQPAQINKGILSRDGSIVTGSVIQNP